MYFAVMGIMARETLAELKGRFSELWSEIWPILAATAAMAAAVLLLRGLGFTGQSETPWVGLVLLSASGAVAYSAALLAVGSPVIGEVAEVAGWIFRRHNVER